MARGAGDAGGNLPPASGLEDPVGDAPLFRRAVAKPPMLCGCYLGVVVPPVCAAPAVGARPDPRTTTFLFCLFFFRWPDGEELEAEAGGCGLRGGGKIGDKNAAGGTRTPLGCSPWGRGPAAAAKEEKQQRIDAHDRRSVRVDVLFCVFS